MTLNDYQTAVLCVLECVGAFLSVVLGLATARLLRG